MSPRLVSTIAQKSSADARHAIGMLALAIVTASWASARASKAKRGSAPGRDAGTDCANDRLPSAIITNGLGLPAASVIALLACSSASAFSRFIVLAMATVW